MNITIRKKILVVLIFCVVGFLSTSYAADQETPNQAPAETAKLSHAPNVKAMIDAYDPWEGFNRRMYVFNYYFDKYFYLPVVRGYEFITPDYVEDRISSFYKNLNELKNFTNCLFQLKPKDTGITLARFLTNSTIGLAGFYDAATHFGMERRDEDFGQTLGYYGAGAGPYLVLPVFGPSSLRDASGLLVDSVVRSSVYDAALKDAEEKSLILAGVNTLSAIDIRHSVAFRYYKSGSPFEYELVRRLYLDLRRIQSEK